MRRLRLAVVISHFLDVSRFDQNADQLLLWLFLALD